MRRILKKDSALAVGLFSLALGPRLIAAAGRFVTSDELVWVYRSTRFLAALSLGDWAHTAQAGHPGVTTMWCGVVGILLRRLTAPEATAGHLAWLARLAWFDPLNGPALKQLSFFLVAGRLPVAVLTSLAVAGIYLLARRLWGRRVALVGAALLALDPFPMGLSAVLHVDALTASFATMSLLALLIGVTEAGLFPWAALSGVLAGLAVLTKSPAVFLVPFTALVLAVAFLMQRQRNPRKALRLSGAFFLWLVLACLTFYALYPAMWTSPASALQLMFGTASRHAETSARPVFFWGRTSLDPGPFFYPVALAFRTSPVVWLGLLAACPLLLRRGVANRDSRFPLFVLLCFVALFVISMTPPVKKFDRYLVPVFPALDLVAAAGIVWIAERVSRWRRGGAPLVLTAAVVLQALVSLPYMPYFLAYQNPLLGGAKAAAEVLPIGWGEGVNQAASYLNGLEGAEHLRVVAWAMPHFAPLFVGEALPLDETNLLLADYLVIGIGDVQGLAVEVEPLLAEAELVHTVRLGNLDYVYVYANTAYRLAETYIADQARPGDVIVLDAVGQRYDVGLPLHVFAATDDAATVARRLKELTQGRQRLWYVSYPQASPILRKYVAGQLAAEAELISQEKVGAVTVTLYSLPAEVTFVAPAQEFEADFGGQLALVDHVLLTPAVAYPGKVRLVLRWRALAPMTDDYTVFVNLLDQDGRLRGAGGGGALLVDGAFFPTSAWEAGDTAEVEVGLSLEGGLPPGPYQVTVVVSKPDQSGRLAVFDAQGSSAGTAHRVAEVELQPAREQPSLEELLISHRLSQVWDEELELLGYNLAHRVDAGGTVSLGLFWHGRAHMERDYELSVRLQAADGEVAWETVLPLCPYPTGRWSAGAVFHVLYDLDVGADVSAGRYRLVVNVLAPTGELLTPGDFDLAPLEVTSRVHRFEPPDEIQHTLDLRLGENGEVALLGYDLSQTEVAPGGVLPLTLYWRCESPLYNNYTVFTHLLDPGGQVRGQRDNQPQGGAAPTTSWLAGEFIVDEYRIPVDEDAPAGDYRIEVGMYDPAMAVRLPISTADGLRLEGDRVLLDTVITLR